MNNQLEEKMWEALNNAVYVYVVVGKGVGGVMEREYRCKVEGMVQMMATVTGKKQSDLTAAVRKMVESHERMQREFA